MSASKSIEACGDPATVARHLLTVGLSAVLAVACAGACDPMEEHQEAHPANLDPVCHRWESTDNLEEERGRHIAEVLPGGGVLVAGGHGGHGRLEVHRTVEIVHIDGTIGPAAPMAVRRKGHVHARLPDGRILVAAGWHQPAEFLASAEVYDPDADAWSLMPTMHVGRTRASAAASKHGRIVVVGGWTEDREIAADVEQLDPAADDWQLVARLDPPVTEARLAPLWETGVIIVGGYDGDGPTDRVLLVDTDGSRIQPLAAMTKARRGHSLTVLSDGRLLAAGGYGRDGPLADTEIYDPDANSWTPAGEMHEPRRRHADLLLPDGRVLVAGGHREGAVLPYVEVFEPLTGAWRRTADLPRARAGATLHLLGRDIVALVAGREGLGGVGSSSGRVDLCRLDSD